MASLITVGLAAAVIPVVPVDRSSPDDWVRTVDGWERATWRTAPAPLGSRLHPLVPALGLVLLSVMSLAAFPHPQELAPPGPPKIRPVGAPHAWRSAASIDHSQPAT